MLVVCIITFIIKIYLLYSQSDQEKLLISSYSYILIPTTLITILLTITVLAVIITFAIVEFD